MSHHAQLLKKEEGYTWGLTGGSVGRSTRHLGLVTWAPHIGIGKENYCTEMILWPHALPRVTCEWKVNEWINLRINASRKFSRIPGSASVNFMYVSWIHTGWSVQRPRGLSLKESPPGSPPQCHQLCFIVSSSSSEDIFTEQCHHISQGPPREQTVGQQRVSVANSDHHQALTLSLSLLIHHCSVPDFCAFLDPFVEMNWMFQFSVPGPIAGATVFQRWAFEGAFLFPLIV